MNPADNGNNVLIGGRIGTTSCAAQRLQYSRGSDDYIDNVDEPSGFNEDIYSYIWFSLRRVNCNVGN